MKIKKQNNTFVANISKDKSEIMACKVCHNRLNEIKKQEQLNEEELFILRHPKKSLLVNYPVRMDDGKIVEQNEPEKFFEQPESERLKLFLSQILRH